VIHVTADNIMCDRLEQAIARIKKQTTVDVGDGALAMGVARATAYSAVKSGEWPSIRAMSRIRIPTKWLRNQLMLDED
jgi:hypothetical protein